MAEQARALQREPGPRCGVADALEAFGSELQEALDDRDITATALEDTLAQHGWTISEYTLRRHRNGRCRC